MPLNTEQIATLAILANGIIPPDETDAGAGSVDAGRRLASKVQANSNEALYLRGIEMAATLAQEKFGRQASQLSAEQVHELIAEVRELQPDFFKQLRLDVAALYLSDPAVWQRIGFPGPSIMSGGYPDFDQPQ